MVGIQNAAATSKKKKTSGHHQKDWEEKYAGVIKLSLKDEEHTYCIPCYNYREWEEKYARK